jgi:hypothetical protein
MLRRAYSGLLAVAVAAVVGVCSAEEAPPIDQTDPATGERPRRIPIDEALGAMRGGHEEAGPAPLRVEPGPQARTPRMIVTRGGVVTTQANVDAMGMNIVGDAANEPSIGVDPTAPNRMAIGWRQFDTIASSFREAGYSRSNDGGRAWAGSQEIESGIFRSDPVLEVSPDGVFYYLSISIDPFPNGPFLNDMFLSTDGGATWPGKSFAFGGDKAWYAIDTTDGPGAGNLYQSWNTAGNEFFPAQYNRSTDGGLSWSTPTTIPEMPIFGTQAVGKNGELFIIGIQNFTDEFWVIRTTQADATDTPTFDQVVQVDMGGAMLIGIGVNPAGLLGQAFIAVDPSDGPTGGFVYALCSISPSAPGPEPLDIHFIRSEDGGLTWSAPVRVNDDPAGTNAWQWFGTMSVAPNGRIDAVWLDTRNDATPVSPAASQLYTSSSTDGGLTWSPNQSISPSFNHSLGYPQQNKLGDYFDMRSDLLGADLAWAATFTGGQDVYYSRIGAYDCDADGLSDEDQIALDAGLDCNDNGILDSCEIAAGAVDDLNGNGIPDPCDPSCLADLNGDGVVDTADLGILITAFGSAGPLADLNGDNAVDTADLGILITAFGTLCPTI